MREPERLCPIEKETLNERAYFSSFLQSALSFGLLNDSDSERIQNELLSLVSRQIERYNNGDSSSIRVETAQELTDSIFYTIGVFLKPKAVSDALDAVKTRPLAQLFAAGQKMILRKVSVCKLSHVSLVRNLFQTSNEFYTSTVRDGIGGFFKLYRPETFAHRTIITADYPTMCGEGLLCGIEFIERYLHNLFFENAFLRHFSSETAHAFLSRYNPAYEKTPANLCEPILYTALLCELCNKDPLALSLTSEDIDVLESLLGGKSRDELHFYLTHAATLLLKTLSCDEALTRYMREATERLLPSFENAVRFHTLAKLCGVQTRSSIHSHTKEI